MRVFRGVRDFIILLILYRWALMVLSTEISIYNNFPLSTPFPNTFPSQSFNPSLNVTHVQITNISLHSNKQIFSVRYFHYKHKNPSPNFKFSKFYFYKHSLVTTWQNIDIYKWRMYIKKGVIEGCAIFIRRL